jgi:hypothetical protein
LAWWLVEIRREAAMAFPRCFFGNVSRMYRKIEQYFSGYDDLNVSIDLSQMRFFEWFLPKNPGASAFSNEKDTTW